MKVKDIAFIIIHFKNVKDTLETLKSLYQATLPKGVKITPYVVNNDQSEEIKTKLLKLFPKAVHVFSNTNLGFSGGNNLGLQTALKGQHNTFVLINNDVSVKKDFIKQIVTSPITKDNVGIVGGLIYFAPGFEFKKYQQSDQGKVIWYAGGQIDCPNVLASHLGVDQVDKGQYSKPVKTDFVTGCLLITKRTVLEKVWHELYGKISSYIRGKVIEIVLVAVVTIVAFWILELRYAVLLGALVGLSVVIPYIGVVVVTVPVVIVGLIQWGWSDHFFYLMLIYVIITILDANILVPLLFAEVMSLHPLAIILAVLVFGSLFGFWGVFFAIPLMALINVVINSWPKVN